MVCTMHEPENCFIVDNALGLHINRLRLIDEPESAVDGRIELENIVIYSAQCIGYVFVSHHCGVAEHRHLCFGIELVAQQQHVVNNFLEVRVQGRLAVAREGDNVELLAGGVHGAELGIQAILHIVACGYAGGALSLGVVSGFAIHAVERAYFPIVGHKVYAERDA